MPGCEPPLDRLARPHPHVHEPTSWKASCVSQEWESLRVRNCWSPPTSHPGQRIPSAWQAAQHVESLHFSPRLGGWRPGFRDRWLWSCDLPKEARQGTRGTVSSRRWTDVRSIRAGRNSPTLSIVSCEKSQLMGKWRRSIRPTWAEFRRTVDSDPAGSTHREDPLEAGFGRFAGRAYARFGRGGRIVTGAQGSDGRLPFLADLTPRQHVAGR